VRIGVDGYNLAMPHGTGVATYGLALVKALQSMGHQVEGVFGLDVGRDPEMREVRFYDLMGRAREDALFRRLTRTITGTVRPFVGVTATEVPMTGRVERQTLGDRLPEFDKVFSSPDLFPRAHRHFRLFRKFTTLRLPDPPDAMHWTYPVPIEVTGTKNIYTLHDLAPLRLPFTTLDNKQRYNALVRQCIERSYRICTVSESSKTDILARYPEAEGRVFNTYQSAPLPKTFSASDASDDAAVVKGVFGLAPKGYFLYFGAIEPKKNVGRIIEAYLSSLSETPLVIVGGKGWQSEGELKLLNGGGQDRAADRIVQLEFLPRPLLLKLVRGARAVLFPSLYEGFGLPVLEAMQMGTAVITSNSSSLVEVAGGAALLVDPYSVEEITRAILTIDRDPNLRETLERKGLEQAQNFSEERYRERLAKLYA
jgi:glycosyltransferase involved in cell wall biosynthesis